MGPVRQNPIQRTVKSVHICVQIAVLTFPTSIWRPVGGDPVGISLRSLASETRMIALSCDIKVSLVGSLD